MEKESTDSLVAWIGGLQLPGENMARYWFRVSQRAGLGWRSVRAAWHGERVSKNARAKLEQAAKNATGTDDVVALTEYYLKNWRKDPERHRHRIDAACKFIDRLRAFDAEGGDLDLPGRRQAGGEE